jgi:hypothetical protein
VEGFQSDQNMALDGNFHIIKELYLFLYFQKIITPDIKLHLGGDHRSSISTIS